MQSSGRTPYRTGDSSNRRISASSLRAAQARAVAHGDCSGASASAPRSSRNPTISARPERAAAASGVPPQSVVSDLNRYQNVRSASFQAWAEEGEGIFVTTRFGDVSQIHHVGSPGGARTQAI